MSKPIVCLSFDFDAISGWIARDMTSLRGPHFIVFRAFDRAHQRFRASGQ
jgi:hypothetical protein